MSNAAALWYPSMQPVPGAEAAPPADPPPAARAGSLAAREVPAVDAAAPVPPPPPLPAPPPPRDPDPTGFFEPEDGEAPLAHPEHVPLADIIGAEDLETLPAGEAAQIQAAFVEAGVGIGLAGSLLREARSALRAHSAGHPAPSPDDCMAALRRQHGDRATEVVESANELVTRAETKWPGIRDWLDRSGLGNNPKVISRLAARARRSASR